MYVAISPKQTITDHKIDPTKMYEIKHAAGPALTSAVPVPKKKPVPMVPPMAMKLRCLPDSCRCSSPCCAESASLATPFSLPSIFLPFSPTEKTRVMPPTTPMSSPEDEKSAGVVPLAFIGLVWRSSSAPVRVLVMCGRREL